MHVAHRLSLTLMFVLFVLAEILAFSNFWDRRGLHIDIYSACMMPILIAIPLIAALQIRRKISKAFLQNGTNQSAMLPIQYWVASLVAAFYAMLSIVMSILLNAITHLRH